MEPGDNTCLVLINIIISSKISLAKYQDFQMFSSVSSLGSKHCLIEFHTTEN